jgi:hypothetical protein
MAMSIRKISAGVTWFNLKQQSPDAPYGDFPPALLSEFIPRPSDKGWLSCFSVESAIPEHVVKIAGAMSLLVDDRNKAQYHVAVPEASISEAGLAMRVTSGGTHHAQVDAQHVEINVPTTSDLIKLVQVFWDGEPVHLKGGKIGAQAVADVRQGAIGFQAAISAQNPSKTLPIYLTEFLKDGHLWAHGATDIERLLQP